MRVLLVPWGRGAGHVSRLVGLAELLGDHHEYTMVAHDLWRPMIERSGIAHLSCRPEDRWEDPWSNWCSPDFVLGAVEAEIKLIERLEPDLVVHDAKWSVAVAAAATNVPLATVMQSMMFPGFSLDRSRPTIFEDAAASFSSALSSLRMNRTVTDVRELFLEGAMIVPSFPGFDVVPPGLEAVVTHVAPLSHTPESTSEAAMDFTRRFSGRVIYTYGAIDNADQLSRLIEVAADLDMGIFAANLAQNAQNPNIGRDRVFASEYTRLPEVLAHTAVALIHGGHGSCQAMIGAGIPTLSFPISGHLEQEFNATRLELLGSGISATSVNRWERLPALLNKTTDLETEPVTTIDNINLTDLLSMPKAGT